MKKGGHKGMKAKDMKGMQGMDYPPKSAGSKKGGGFPFKKGAKKGGKK